MSRFISHFTTAGGSPATVFYSSLAIQAIGQCVQRNLSSNQPLLATSVLLNPSLYYASCFLVDGELSWNANSLPIPFHRAAKLDKLRIFQLLNQPLLNHTISLVLRSGVPPW